MSEPIICIANPPIPTISTGDDGPEYCPYYLEGQIRPLTIKQRTINPKDIPAGPAAQSQSPEVPPVKLDMDGSMRGRGFLA